MKAKIQYGLEGAFRVALYSGKELVKDTDFFSNFITQTGLNYPLNYSFADCFRFLSLGSGSAVNRGVTVTGAIGTTGLNLPITGFQTSISGISGVQIPQWIGWQAYETGSDGGTSACGTQITAAGPRLFRSWSIPSGGDDVTVQTTDPIGGLMINEFMVSPSSGSDPTGACAFSRVIRSLFIPNGYKAIITYQLKVNIKNTGITPFSSGTFTTGNADTSSDYNLISQWANLSGYYRQVYHGLRCIDSAGATFIPKYGDGMEPSCRSINSLSFYLSPDNSQFDVNPTGAGQTNSDAAYASDGLMGLIKSLELDNVNAYSEFTLDPSHLDQIYYNNNPIISSSIPTDNTPKNIRLGSNSEELKLPSLSDYQIFSDVSSFNYQIRQDPAFLSISYATPGIGGFNGLIENYGQKAVFSTKNVKLPINTGAYFGQNLVTGRKKTLTRKSFFSPVSSLGYNTRFGSLVYAYRIDQNSIGDRNYYPMIDCLFYDTSGRSLMQHYRYITGICLTERGSGILDSQIFLSQTNSDNVTKFTPYHTFQGPYSSPLNHAVLLETPTFNSYFGGATTCPSGTVFEGTLNQTAYGTTGVTGDGFGTTGNNGWGSVYGIVVDENFCYDAPDLGIADHSLQNLLAPSRTGKIGWPIAYPAGNEVRVYASGVTFWDTGMPAIVDTGLWFGTNQILRNVYFEVVQSGNWATIITPSNDYKKHVFPEPVVDGLTIGYYLTNKQFNGEVISDATVFAYNTANPVTGYVVTNSTATAGNNLKGTVWNGSLPSASARLSISPQIYYEDNTFTPPSPMSATTAGRVTGLFLNFTERGYQGGINGTPFHDGDKLNIFLTGFSPTNKPYYLTAVRGSDRSTVTGYSLLSGTVKLTQFKAPTGYPIHADGFNDVSGYRLLPNYGKANRYQSDTYSPTTGGALPALSFDNGLEIYLDISWSSPCGTAVNCNEPI